MGYSRNLSTLEARLPDLQLLIAGKQCIWTMDVGEDVHKFAYKIREALYIARLHKPQMTAIRDEELRRAVNLLALAADVFTIEVVSPTQVQARLTGNTTAAAIEAAGPGVIVMQGMEDAGLAKRMVGPQTAASVIQTWLDAQPSNSRFYFPDANMSRSELIKLNKFARDKKWLIFVADNGAVTMQRATADLEAVAWSPEDDA